MSEAISVSKLFRFSLLRHQWVVLVILALGVAVGFKGAFGLEVLTAGLLMTLNLCLWYWLVGRMIRSPEGGKAKIAFVFLLKLGLLFGGFLFLYGVLGFSVFSLLLGAATLPLAAIFEAIKI